ncbi:MAG: phosphoglucosamine mutase [Spirochaetota bacterium]
MPSQLMKSVSGIRGIVGETMTPELIIQVSGAFAAYMKRGKIVIGRDGRCTGHAISSMVESALVMYGCEVIDVGIAPTPTVQVMVEELNADGGIIISASHNPIEWNAFKLVNGDGTFLNSSQINRFFALLDRKDYDPQPWDKMGQAYSADNAYDVHIKRIVDKVDIASIKKRHYRTALDSVNASGSYITTQFLEYLNCRVSPVYCEITGTFPRVAEPLPQNLTDLSHAVIRHGADIGFAQDPDADRLAIVDENGRPIGEEYTLALVTRHLLSREPGRVIINMSTTKAVEDIAAEFGCDCVRTSVGEINVVDEMKKGARIGGEGNGGIISPEIHLGRDSLAGIAYVLEYMSESGKTVSELVSELPHYCMKKGKVQFKHSRLNTIYSRIKRSFKGEKINDLDGIRIDFAGPGPFAGGWVHLRPSNTEPVFRIITESPSMEQTEELYAYFEKFMASM